MNLNDYRKVQPSANKPVPRAWMAVATPKPHGVGVWFVMFTSKA